MTEFSEERYAPWRSVLLSHSAAIRAIEAEIHAAGSIPLGWYDVLLELRYAPDRTHHMQDLAEHVVLSRSRVSRIVDELEAEGYVERSRCPADGRAMHASLTKDGAAALRRAAPVYLAAVERHFVGLIPENLREPLVRALQPVLDAHGRGGPAPGGRETGERSGAGR